MSPQRSNLEVYVVLACAVACVLAACEGTAAMTPVDGGPTPDDAGGMPMSGSCTFNSQTIASGSAVTAYQAATVSADQSCVSQQRTCTNGTLSGSYAFAACAVATPMPCSFNGASLASGTSAQGYSAATVPNGQLCSSVQETVTCNDGMLTPANAFATCMVATMSMPMPCAFDGSAIASGASITAWLAASVPVGQTCMSQLRTCTNGSLSGTYAFATCSAQQAASCMFAGQTVASGATAIGYTASAVPSGQTCASVQETVTCTNGVLSPSNALASCIVTGAAPTLVFTAMPASVMAGTLPGVTLTWTSTNVTSCTASDSWDNSAFAADTAPLSGTMTRAFETNGTFGYTLSCTGPGGTVMQSVPVSATAMPAQAPLSTNAACKQPGPPYPQTGQPGISFPGGSTTQSGAAAPIGCPSTTVFDGLSTILDQSPHVPRHAVNAAAGAMPSALATAALPYIPNVYVLSRQDATILFVPNVAGAADYRAYVVGNGVTFTTTANGTQPRGAVVACAGFRQHTYESAVVNGHHARELLQAIEVPGFVAAGDYTIVVEAIASPCPFIGIPSGANATFASDPATFANPLAEGTYDTGGALAVLRTPATMMATYGNEIVNGQGSWVSWSNRLTQQIGKPVPANDATLPSDPVVIARSAVALQLPFFDETTNAPKFDVGPNSLFDNFTAETTFTASTTALNPDYSGQHKTVYPYFFLGATSTLAPTAANAAAASYAFWGMNVNAADSTDALTGATTDPSASFNAFQHLGRLYTAFGDEGQDVSSAMGFSSMKTLPEPLDSELYVHSMFRINSESTMRRYWWWTMCGGATQAELMDPTTHIPVIRPTFYETSFAGGGNNPSIPTMQPISGTLTPDAKAKECLSMALDGVAEYPRQDGAPRSSASIKLQIHPAGYSGGIIPLGTANSDNQQVVADGSGEKGFRYRLDKSGNYAGPLVDPFDQLQPLVHYDIFVRSDRVVVFINGRQGFCVDLSSRPLEMKYGLITYGDLIYHSALEYAITSPQYIGGKYTSSDTQTGDTNGSADQGSQLYNNVLNAPIVSSRVWDVVAQSSLVPIPPQFSTFDPSLCKPPASVTAH